MQTIAEGNPTFDATAAKTRLLADHKRDSGGYDAEAGLGFCAVLNDGNSDADFVLPFADVSDGKLQCIEDGVRKAMLALPAQAGLSAAERRMIEGFLNGQLARCIEQTNPQGFSATPHPLAGAAPASGQAAAGEIPFTTGGEIVGTENTTAPGGAPPVVDEEKIARGWFAKLFLGTDKPADATAPLPAADPGFSKADAQALLAEALAAQKAELTAEFDAKLKPAQDQRIEQEIAFAKRQGIQAWKAEGAVRLLHSSLADTTFSATAPNGEAKEFTFAEFARDLLAEPGALVSAYGTQLPNVDAQFEAGVKTEADHGAKLAARAEEIFAAGKVKTKMEALDQATVEFSRQNGGA